jgi:hypothetical protein
MGRFLWVISGLALLGCQAEPAPKGPVGTYRAFYMAIGTQQSDLAVTYLSPNTRKTFTRIGQGLAESVGQQGDPLQFFLRGLRAEVTRPLHAVELVNQEGDQARLRVVAGRCDADGGNLKGCSVSEVKLVRVDSVWLIEVDLPKALVQSAAGRGEEK